ncbi:hypothetical protein [Luethyella okanaganae]|uniref:Uncharacterized protein n=1 Tax=Luethyella okanaganae TaxID=69372 RepID=A0ABW1VGL2_9MICO
MAYASGPQHGGGGADAVKPLDGEDDVVQAPELIRHGPGPVRQGTVRLAAGVALQVEQACPPHPADVVGGSAGDRVAVPPDHVGGSESEQQASGEQQGPDGKKGLARF